MRFRIGRKGRRFFQERIELGGRDGSGGRVVLNSPWDMVDKIRDQVLKTRGSGSLLILIGIHGLLDDFHVRVSRHGLGFLLVSLKGINITRKGGFLGRLLDRIPKIITYATQH